MLAGAGPTVGVGKLNRAFSSCHSLASSFVLMGSGPGSWSSSLKLFGAGENRLPGPELEGKTLAPGAGSDWFTDYRPWPEVTQRTLCKGYSGQQA